MPEPNLSYLLNLKPVEIIKWFESKGNTISWDWQEVYAQAHAKSFTVAKAMKIDILQTIRDEYISSLNNGGTPREFTKNLEPTLKKLGWWGKQKAKDVPGYNPASGVDPEKVVQLGSPHRLQKIFRINSTVAYNAQRYKFQMENVQTHPYLQYIQVQRPSKRDEHAKFDKKVFRYDDPIVSIIYPPSDWECKCRMVGKSASDLKNEGLKVSNGKDFDTSDIPEEWRYNPGEAAFFPNLNKYNYSVASQYIVGGLKGPDFDEFFREKIKGNFPVAVLDDQYSKLIKAKSQTVFLSTDSLQKNKKEHKELTVDNYRALPSIISEAQVIIQDGDQTMVFIRVGENIYHTVIKATKDGEELYLTSFRPSNLKDIERMKKKGNVVKNDL
jgi:hypothetical protein